MANFAIGFGIFATGAVLVMRRLWRRGVFWSVGLLGYIAISSAGVYGGKSIDPALAPYYGLLSLVGAYVFRDWWHQTFDKTPIVVAETVETEGSTTPTGDGENSR